MTTDTLMCCPHREFGYADDACNLLLTKGVKEVSTRVEGAEPPVILLTAKAIEAVLIDPFAH